VDDFSRYLKAAARLYKSLEYERALEQVQRAKKLANTLDQDVAVALHEGIILADLGKREESLVAFKTALLLDPDAKVATAHRPAIAECVEKQREQQPGVSGKLVMRWSVQPDGSVKEVTCHSGELCSTYLAGCLTGLIQGWTFPVRGGAAETVELPLTF
jgi:tetratricopeptide (TPR) repeat protein